MAEEINTSIVFKRRDNSGSLCERCERRRVLAGEKICARCLVIMERSGETLTETIIENIMCLQCKRKRTKKGYQYCDRCIVITERQLGHKVKSIRELQADLDKKKVEEETEEKDSNLCTRCGRRAKEEGKQHCQRCVVLIAREIEKLLKGEDLDE